MPPQEKSPGVSLVQSSLACSISSSAEKTPGVSTFNSDLILAPASAGEVSGSANIQLEADDVKS